MSPEPASRLRRSTELLALAWILLFGSTAFLAIHAGLNWKFPTFSAEKYWASRLTGLQQAFLGSDDQWRYFALEGAFLHGWKVGKVGHAAARAGRDACFRAHVDEWLSGPRDGQIQHLQQLTGLPLGTSDLWHAWWEQNRDTCTWPHAEEERWEKEVSSRFADSWGHEARDWYLEEIPKLRRRILIEVLFFAAILALIWPVGPKVLSVAVRRLRMNSFLARMGLAVIAIMVLYVVIVFPHVFWGYGMGACTTLHGPGFLSYSGPYPFSLHYVPFDTILYRQFLELVFDPAVRLGEVGFWRWLPSETLLVMIAWFPYVALTLAVGILMALHRRILRRRVHR